MPEQKWCQKCREVFASGVFLLINIANIIISAAFFDDDDDIKFAVWLIVTSIVSIALSTYFLIITIVDNDIFGRSPDKLVLGTLGLLYVVLVFIGSAWILSLKGNSGDGFLFKYFFWYVICNYIAFLTVVSVVFCYRVVCYLVFGIE